MRKTFTIFLVLIWTTAKSAMTVAGNGPDNAAQLLIAQQNSSDSEIIHAGANERDNDLLPDLTVTSLHIPTNPIVGGTYPVIATVGNIGFQNAMSIQIAAKANGIHLLNSPSTIDLNAGDSTTLNWEWDTTQFGYTSGIAVDFDISLDPSGLILEVNENNNSRNSQTTIFDLTTGLLAHYPFQGNANDVSGSDYHGFIRGASFVQGIRGDGINFDGIDDYIAIQNLQFTNPSSLSQLSICAWIRTTFMGIGYSDNWSITDFDRSEYFNFYIRGDNGRVGFSTTDGDRHHDDFSGITTVNDGSWHYVCAVYDGVDKVVYVNGIEDNRKLNPHRRKSLGTGGTRFGFIGDGSEAASFDGERNQYYYHGDIDELLLADRALSAAEIQGYYNYFRPDFRISNIQLLATPTIGNRYPITATVENIGNVNASDINVQLAVNGVEIPYTGSPLSIPAGGAVDVIWQWDTNNFNYFFGEQIVFDVTLDPDNSIDEINDLNNTSSMQTTMGENLPPAVDSVVLTSASSTKGDADDLFGTVTASDPNLDSLILIYTWMRDGATVGKSVFIDDPNLIVYYPFNHDTLDYARANDGINNGARLNAKGGIIGAAYSFDGIDNDVTNLSLDTSISGDLTISLWTKAVNPDANSRLFELAQAADIGLQIVFSDTIRIDNSGGPSASAATSNAMNDGRWHHIVVIRNGPTYSLYADGIIQASVGGEIPTYTRLYIAQNQGNSSHFRGLIDEIQIYDRALTAAEVQVLYLGSAYGGDAMDSSQLTPGEMWSLGVKAADSELVSIETRSNSITVTDTTPPTITFTSPTPVENSTIHTQEMSVKVNINEEVASCEMNLGNLNFGNESDGDLIVSNPNTIVNAYTYLSGKESSEETEISVGDATDFGAGDQIMLIQMQNSAKDTVGIYEFATIDSINGNDITLREGLTNSYDSGKFNSTNAVATQIVRVPQYTQLVVTVEGSITAPKWNGRTGGIIALRATDGLSVDGSLDVSGRGYRGGRGASIFGTNHAGESITGVGVFTRSPNFGGGGAGGVAACCAAGGGGGGYADGPGGAGGTRNGNGSNGKIGGNSNSTKINLGSGGGGGYGGHGEPAGGNGGGAIFVVAGSLDISGKISSNGMNGQRIGNSGGGGGAGGAIVIQSNSINMGNKSVEALGGVGGNGVFVNGGHGANGRIVFDSNAIVGSTSPVAVTPGTASADVVPMTVVNNGANTIGYVTVSDLEAMTYFYNVTCEDLAANLGNSETRQLSVEVLNFSISTTSLMVPENGTNSFTVQLDNEPQAPIQATLTISGDSDLRIISVISITFDHTNWDIPQPVSIAAADDSDAENGIAVVGITAENVPTAQISVAEDEDEFTPDDLNGLSLWLKANDLRLLNDGDPVSEWLDASGNQVYAGQLSIGQQPVFKIDTANGQSVVRFDGDDDYLSIPADILDNRYDSYTVFYVFRTSTDDAQVLMTRAGLSNDTSAIIHGLSRGGRLTQDMDSPPPLSHIGNVPVNDGSFRTATLIRDGVNDFRKIFIGGILDSTQLPIAESYQGNPVETTLIGVDKRQTISRHNFNGDVGEIIVYDAALVPKDRQLVEQYLINKYGIDVFPKLVLSDNTISIPEGETATLTVRLSKPPFAVISVNVAVDSGDPDILIQSGGMLTFDSTNWNIPKTVTFSAVQDDSDADNGTARIVISSPELVSQVVTAMEVEKDAKLTIATTGNAAIQPALTSVHPIGSTVTVSADPDIGYEFIKWTGDTNTVTDVYRAITEVTLLQATSLVATIAARQYVVSVNLNGEGSVDGAGIVSHGSEVTLTAIPKKAGHHFVNWTGDQIHTENPLMLVATADLHLTANFAENPPVIIVPTDVVLVTEGSQSFFEIVLSKAPQASVTIAAAVSTGDPDLSIEFGDQLVFATDNWHVPQRIFIAAVEDNVDTEDGTAQLTLSSLGLASQTVTLKEVDNDVTLTLSGNENGQLFPAGTTVHPINVSVDIEAIPNEGYHFVSWAGDTQNTADTGSASTSVVLRNNTNIAAHFETNTYSVIASVTGEGTVHGAATYVHGQNVTLTATPDDGHDFVEWTGDIHSTDNPLVFTITRDVSVEASFAQNAPAVVLSENDLTIKEGSSKSTEVTLSRQPNSPVTLFVTLVSGDPVFNISDGARVIFTGTNWQIPQSITVTAAENNGDVESSDARFRVGGQEIIPEVLTVTEIDNDKTLTLLSDGNGVVTPEGTTIHPQGASVAIKATPNTGYTFTNWTRNTAKVANVNAPNTTVNLVDNTTLSAGFSLKEYTVSTAVNGDGTIEGAGTHPHGSLVTLTASPEPGYHFAEWAGDMTGTANPLTFEITANTNIIASFEKNPPNIVLSTTALTVTEGDTRTVSLTLSRAPRQPTTIAISKLSGDADIRLASSSLPTFNNSNWNEPQILEFTADEDDHDADDGIATFELTSPGITKATLDVGEEDNDFRLTVLASANGSVIPSGTAVYVAGDEVNVRAIPDFGYDFEQWSGDTNTMADSNAAETTLIVNGNQSLTANFAIEQYTVTVQATNGSVSGDGAYDHGALVNLTATPDSGFQFASWSGDFESGANPLSFVLPGDIRLMVNFIEARPDIIVSENALSIPEGQSDSVTIRLSTPPASAIIVSTTSISGDPSIRVQSPEQLTFDSSNWNTPQTVTVTVVENDGDANDGSALIEFVGAGLIPVNVDVTEIDNDFRLTISAENGTPEPGGTTVYPSGSMVNLNAFPDVGYHFVNWSGDVVHVTGTDAPSTSVTLVQHTQLTANFEINVYDVSVNALNGSVAGTGSYNHGARVILQANPDSDYHFVDWTGDRVSKANPLVFTIENDTTVTANFTEKSAEIRLSTTALRIPEGGANSFAMTLSKAPETPVIVSSVRGIGDSDINVQSGSQLMFDSSNWDQPQSVVLAAAEDDRDADNSLAQIDITGPSMTPVSLLAEEVDNDFVLFIDSLNGSTIPAGIIIYPAGSRVALAAFPENGYHFTKWSGDIEGLNDVNAETTEVTIAKNTTLTANFDINQYTVTVDATHGTVIGAQSYSYGDSVELIATPNTGYHFVDWTGDIASDEHPLRFIITEDVNLQANFAENPPAILPSTTELIVPEGGTQTIGLTLSKDPERPLSVMAEVVSGDPDITIDSNSQITFDSANWNRPGTIMLSAAEDDLDVLHSPAIVSLSAPGFAPVHIKAIEADNDVKLTLTSSILGSVDPGGDSIYDMGTSVSISAMPNPGYRFVRWSGDINNVNDVSAADTRVNLVENVEIIAEFEINQYIVDITAVNGVVSGSGRYAHGETVTIIATPVTDYHFVEWSGDLDSITNPLTFEITESMAITAHFAENFPVIVPSVEMLIVPEGDSNSFGVTLSKPWPDPLDIDVALTSDNANLTLDSPTQLIFNDGNWNIPQYVVITAIEDNADAENGSATVELSGSGLITTNVMVKEEDNDVVLTLIAENGATTPPRMSIHAAGVEVPIRIEPDFGYLFAGWSGDTLFVADPSSPETTVTMSQDVELTANFGSDVHTLTVLPSENGSVTGGGAYTHGHRVQLTAVPDPNYFFRNWTGDVTGSVNPLVFVIPSDISVSANFKEFPKDFELTPNPVVVQEGGMNTVDVTLTKNPYRHTKVTISSVSGDPDLSIPSNPQLTFSAANWNIPQTITLVAAEDDIDGDSGTAIFEVSASELTSRFLTVTEEDNDFNLVLSTKNGVVDPAGKTAHLADTVVPISATPHAGFYFKKWSGDITNVTDPLASSSSVTMHRHTNLVAEIVDLPGIIVSSSQLTVPEGASDVFTVSLTNAPPTLLKIMVTVNEGDPEIGVVSGSELSFDETNWQIPQPVTVIVNENDDNAKDGSATLNVTFANGIDQPVTVTEIDNDFSLILSSSGKGVVTPSGTTIHRPGAFVMISAMADEHYRFNTWTGDTTNIPAANNEQVMLTMNSNTKLVANFQLEDYFVNVETNGHGSVVGEGKYPFGSTVVLHAIPDPGYRFQNWVGAANKRSNPLSLTVEKDLNITANFVSTLHSLTIIPPLNGSIHVGKVGTVFHYGDRFAITPKPDRGYHFSRWIGDVGSVTKVNNSVTDFELTIDGDTTLSAEFTPNRLPTLAYDSITQKNDGSGRVVLRTLLTDPDDEGNQQLAIAKVEYSLNLGVSWNETAFVQKPVDAVTGLFEIEWDSKTQGIVETDVVFRITVNDGIEDGDPVLSNPFHVDNKPPEKATNFAVDSEEGNHLTFTWTPSPSPDVKEVLIYTDAGTGVIDFNNPIIIVNAPSTVGTSGRLAPGNSRFVIRTRDKLGNIEENTDIMTYILAPLEKPTLLSPLGGEVVSGYLPVKFLASPNQGTYESEVQYEIQYTLATNPSDTDWIAAVSANNGPSTTEQFGFFTLNVTSLSLSSLIKIRIRGYDGLGYSEWGSSNGFVSLLPPPVVIDSPLTIETGENKYHGFDIAVDGVCVTLNGMHSFNSLQIVNNGCITHSSTTGSAGHDTELHIDNSLFIDGSSSIDVTGGGYPTGHSLGNRHDAASNAAGGSYGGYGGEGDGRTNEVYGDFQMPTLPGSGAGAANGGGRGGGVIRIIANGVNLEGRIMANGEDGKNNDSGGGSGGSIWITTSLLRGHGKIQAEGGKGVGNGGGGGGGRIAVEYSVTSFDMTGLSAFGGMNGDRSGGAGTIYRVDHGASETSLLVNNLTVLPADSVWPTPLWLGNRHDGRDDPIVFELDEFVISDNAAATVETSPTLFDIKRVHVTDASFFTKDVLIISEELLVSNAYYEADHVIAESRISLVQGSVMTPRITTAFRAHSLAITTSYLELDPTSTIDASGRGYRQGYSHGNVPYNAVVAGGSYGGLGGAEGVCNECVTYGLAENPNELGAGAGASGRGGNGGGLIRITADTITLDGAILVNGESFLSGSSASGGSGGGMYVEACNLLQGAGSMYAIGGDGNTSGYGGGGGRIALYYGATMSPQVDISVDGGTGLIGDETGSIHFENGPGFLAVNAILPEDDSIHQRVDQVIVNFSGSIQADTFTTADIRINGPNGPITPLSIDSLNSSTYRIVVPSIEVEGTVDVIIDPDVVSSCGSMMNQDFDVIRGEATEDAFISSFTIDRSPPSAPEIDPIAFVPGTLNQTVSGTKEVGTDIWLNGQLIVPPSEDTEWSYAINFPFPGSHKLLLSSHDEAGNESGLVSITFDMTGVYEVNTMPARFVRPDAKTIIWGNVNRGGDLIGPTTYDWRFDHDENVSVIPIPSASILTGDVVESRNIATQVKFALNSGATSSRVGVELVVSDGGIELTSTTWIDVVARNDPSSVALLEAQEIDRKIAIENGLYHLYLHHEPDNNNHYEIAATAAVAWAFQNHGHIPKNDPAQDIYQPFVVSHLNYLFSISTYEGILGTPIGNPDANGNGLGIHLGGKRRFFSSGYYRAIALAALASSNSPLQKTFVGNFYNSGAGTTYLEIAQDTADTMNSILGRSENGGWTYRDRPGETDNSINSWHYVALEGVMELGGIVPGWVPAKCEESLALTYIDDGRFRYRPGRMPSTATTGGGLTGLTFVTLEGRTPGIDVGAMKLQTLKTFSNSWGPGKFSKHGAWYDMWTVSRALRTANVRYLNPSDGEPFDWQRNPVVGDKEGYWPYLIRTQLSNGSWSGRPLEDSFFLLCLSEGVIGEKAVVRNVEITSHVPKNDNLQIIPSSHRSEPPVITDHGDSLQLQWSLGDLPAGSSIDLSYDQYLENLKPGERRQVQEELTVAYSSEQSFPIEQSLGPLHVDVKGSNYDLTITSLADSYLAGQTARFDTTVTLPTGQEFYQLKDSLSDHHTIDPGLESGVSWTTIEFVLINEADFDSDDIPVSIRLRGAPSEATLPTASYSNPITRSGTRIDLGSSRVLELELVLTTNQAGAIPELGYITLYFNSKETALIIDVLDLDNKVIDIVSDRRLFPSDYGKSVDFANNWATSDTPPGEYQVRAHVIENDAIVAVATDTFTIESTVSAESITTSLATDFPTYTINDNVIVTSRIVNDDPNVSFENVLVQIEITDSQSTLVTEGRFNYAVGLLEPEAFNSKELMWNTALNAPGTYTVTQTVTPKDLDPIVKSTTFDIGASIEFSEGLVGDIGVAPDRVEVSELFNVDWSITNTGNVDLSNLDITQRIVDANDPTNPESEVLSNTKNLANLRQGESVVDIWMGADSTTIPPNEYVIVLEVHVDGGESIPIAVTNFTVFTLDTEPPQLIVPNDVTLECPTDIRPETTGEATATDPCGISSIVHADTAAIFGCGNTETIIRTWTATDGCGNTATATQTLIVQDITAPVLNGVPADETVSCDSIPDPPEVTATDNCDSQVVVEYNESRSNSKDLSASAPQRETITRTWTATDDCGNTATASQIITVEDTTAPILNGVPVDGTVQCDAIPPPPSVVTAVDNCDSEVLVAFNETRSSPENLSALTPQQETVIRTWTAMDSVGNIVTSRQTITVEDTAAPVLSGVPADQTVRCDTIPVPPNVVATDICDPDVKVEFTESFNSECPRTITRRWTATDDSGNTTSATQALTIDDTAVPILSGVPADATVSCDAIPASPTVTAIDGCGSDIGVEFEETASGRCPQVITRVWSATNACGRTVSATQTLTVEDMISPNLVSPNPISILLGNINPLGCSLNDTHSTAADWLSAVSANDSCGQITVTNDHGPDFPVGLTTVTFTATDECGNSTSGTSTVSVIDNVPPLARCKNITVELDANASGSITPTDINDGSTDACGSVSLSIDKTTFTCSDLGSNNVIMTVADNQGNTAICSSSVVVADTGNPPLCSEINAQIDFLNSPIQEGETVTLNGSFVDKSDRNTQSYQWNFGDGTPTVSNTLMPSHTYRDSGRYTVVLTVSNDHGAQDSASIIVNVLNVAPKVYLDGDQTVNEYESVSFSGSFSDPGANDIHTIEWDFGDGSPIVTETLTPTHHYANSGVFTVTLTITDDDGGRGTETVVVTVVESPPAIEPPTDLSARAKSGKISVIWSHVGAESYNVYRSDAGGDFVFITNTTSTYSTYLDTGLTNNVTYCYFVRPVDIRGQESQDSNTACATPTLRRRRR